MSQRLEETEEELSLAGMIAAEAIRVAELVLLGLAVLLVCPPLLILIVVVGVPLVLIALVISVFALPVIAVRHLHAHRGAHARRHVRRLGRAAVPGPAPVRGVVVRVQRKLFAE
jgi:hypothetical protein